MMKNSLFDFYVKNKNKQSITFNLSKICSLTLKDSILFK